ncbi:hypothetical protein BB560_002021 [Smittium megazygosporum]|uniref:Secreted protein n=1 Tax=Smittium megazygosporum TaxID=133381 RepID=A0A2T9ZFY4_9FUNG|nr:hypothetical protein BB560_002021 [Smittium megazygosporum]
MKITISTLILFLSPVFSASEILSSKSNKKDDLNKVMDAVGVKRFKCSPGYIGFDCPIPNDQTLNKLSCYLQGKPGYSKGGVFIANDLENTGLSCPNKKVSTTTPTKTTTSTTPTTTTSTTSTTSTAYTTPTTSTKTTTSTTPAVYTTPTMPAARAACPLIVDIQKCMNKCVDDVLN